MHAELPGCPAGAAQHQSGGVGPGRGAHPVAPGRGHQLGDGQACLLDPALEGGDVSSVHQGMVDGWDRVLPEHHLRRHQGSQVAGAGPHVPVNEFEPGAAEGLRQLLGMGVEAPGDLQVGRIDPPRTIGGGHQRRVPLRWIVGIGCGVCRRRGTCRRCAPRRSGPRSSRRPSPCGRRSRGCRGRRRSPGWGGPSHRPGASSGAGLNGSAAAVTSRGWSGPLAVLPRSWPCRKGHSIRCRRVSLRCRGGMEIKKTDVLEPPGRLASK